ncbi:MAG: hypothetical protein MJ214_03370 [Bacilli bacterium]|nr:hypothetical protein [Bacilli bacterium]
MKKIKFILPVCLGLVTLVACDQAHGQPESNFYKISFVNVAEEDTDKPEITFESSNLIEKGKDCDLLIRLAPYSTFNEIEGEDEDYLIRQSSLTGDGPILNKNCYSFAETETAGEYRLQIPKEYMTASYDVIVNYTYVKYGTDSVVPSDDIENDVSVIVTNSSVNHDLTFHIMPNNFQAGATFDVASKDNIKIVGNSTEEGVIDLTLDLSRKELVHIDSSIQGISHYHTDTKSLRCALPMEKLYKPAPKEKYGYKKRFDKIEVRTIDTSKDPVSYDKERYLNLFNAQADSQSCKLTSATIDDNYHYKATFTANNDYYFYDGMTNFALTDLAIQPGIYSPTGHPYFREFAVHKDASKRGNIDEFSPYGAYIGAQELFDDYSYVYDKLGNIYSEMRKWLTVSVTDFYYKTLTIEIKIPEMVKYTQLPTSTIISSLDLTGYEDYHTFYSGGSIDFIKSIDFKVAAY